MKRLFTISIALLLGSCLSEKGVEPGTSPTFIRYYYGGNSDTAVGFEQTSDRGFIIAANVAVTTNGKVRNKVKLIKTDENGNVTWSHVYPDFGSADDQKSYKPSGLQILPSDAGYVVVGEDIQQNNTNLLILTVDASGNMTNHASIPNPSAPQNPILGKSVAVNSTGNYTVLSAAGSSEMLLAELKKTDFSTAWTPRIYDAGSTALNNKLFLDETGKIFWSSTVTKSTVTGIRVVKTSPNAQNTDFDLTLLNPIAGISEEANDFTRFGYGYAVVGSTTAKTDDKGVTTAGADKDILFMRLAQDGTILSRKSFPLSASDTQNDSGSSVSSTQDGGLILLASVNSAAINGAGDNDFYLIKINAFGDEEWRASFGSRFRDTGVAVRQASDGNYVVLGSTNLGNRDIIVLAKTNKVGKIE